MIQNNPVSIVVADDHPVVLHGIVSILRTQRDRNVLAECTDGPEPVQAIREFAPDVAVLDVSRPGLNGLDVLASVIAEGAKTKIVFLTAAVTDDQVLAAIANGAKGIVLKDSAPDCLIDCVRDVATGKQWFPIDLVE